MIEGIIEKELSYEILGAAYAVHNELGPGFLESIYEEAMGIELKMKGHNVESHVRVPVNYRGKQVVVHVLDHIVNEKVILEFKAVSEIAPIHKQQALS